MSAAPQRSDVLAMLATYRDRRPEDVPERIDSLELTWLVYQIEQRCGVFDADDATLDRMRTVSGVVDVLAERGVELSRD